MGKLIILEIRIKTIAQTQAHSSSFLTVMKCSSNHRLLQGMYNLITRMIHKTSSISSNKNNSNLLMKVLTIYLPMSTTVNKASILTSQTHNLNIIHNPNPRTMATSTFLQQLQRDNSSNQCTESMTSLMTVLCQLFLSKFLTDNPLGAFYYRSTDLI